MSGKRITNRVSATKAKAGSGRHRRARRPRPEVGAWLGAGALTLGVGAVMASGSAVAHADTTHPGAAASTSATGTAAAAGPKVGSTAKTSHASRTTPGAGAAVPIAAPTSTGVSLRSVLAAGPVVVHPSLLTAVVKPAAVVAPITAAANKAAAASKPAAAVTTTGAASLAVPPLQGVLNAVTNALLSLGGLNTTTPTPASGNVFQLVLYSAARWLQNTFNPGGIPKAVGTLTVGTPDPSSGAVVFNPKVFTTASGAPLTYQVTVDPTLGKVTVNADGVYTFTPTTAERLTVPAGGGTVPLSLIVYNGAQSISETVSAQVNPAILTLAPTPIPVGKYPVGLAVSPNGSDLVVTNSNEGTGGTVSVINTHTDTVAATLPVGQDPQGVTISPDGLTAYVANNDNSGAVSVVSLATNTVTGALNALSFPVGVAVGPANTPAAGRIYVANFQYVYQISTSANVHQVSVLNTATKAVVADITVGTVNPSYNGPTGVAVSPNGTHVYVVNTGDGTVSVINTATNKVTATIPVPQIVGNGSLPEDIAVSPDGSVVYVTGTTVNTQTDVIKSTVSVINTSTNTVIRTIPTGNQAGSTAVAVSPDGTQLYVTNDAFPSGDGTVSVINV